ncbi:MAG: hypothetical protein ABDH49_00715 [Candidatus Hydrothermales bacterium]
MNFLIFLIFSLNLQIEPKDPAPEDKITINLSKRFSGYFWWIEISGGDPYKLIPHVEKIDNVNKISLTSSDKNTSLIIFFFEDKKGKFIMDTSFYMIYYRENKPLPHAFSLLALFYFYEKSLFPNFQKFESLWLKERRYYENHYDFMDNFYEFALKLGKKKLKI